MNRRHFLSALGTVAALSPSLARAALHLDTTRVTGCRLETDGGGARLTLDLSGTVPYRVFTLSSPSRVVIDLQQVAAYMPALHMDGGNPWIADVRNGRHGDGMRIVLDLRHDVKPQAVMQSAAAATGMYQLVVHLPFAGAAAAVRPTRRPAVIAIDAGHGGKDPGAISTSNVYEKYVALAIATKLHGLLATDSRFQPTMTRNDDYFIPLEERVQIAHRENADLFVSIHADAAPVPSAQGASVWVLSQHGATSTMARWLANSENSSDQYASLKNSALYTPDPALMRVLVDMSMDATIAYSLDLGRLMIDNLGQVTRIHQRQVDQAGFAVLKSPDIPSILVETGFMSNADDCRRLVTDQHQQELAEALKSGIANYFRQYPLQSTAA